MARGLIPFLGVCILFGVGVRPALGEDTLYGPEFTFTSPGLVLDAAIDYARHLSNGGNMEHKKNKIAVPALAQAIQTQCEGCEVTKVIRDRYGKQLTHYRVSYPDGFWFELMPDPGVVEVTAKPQTIPQWTAQSQRVQRDLFDVAASLKLHPSALAGGGHINLGSEEAFGSNALLFRNFLVDLVNNPAMNSRGGKGARSIHSLSPSQQQEFAKAIRDFDEGRIKTKEGLAKRIVGKVYGGKGQASRYMALALSYMRASKDGKPIPKSSRRLELRGVAAQQSMDQFLQQIEIVQGRLDYLAKKREPIPLSIPNGWISAKRTRQNFQNWVTESGLNLERYQNLPILPPLPIHAGNALEFGIGRCMEKFRAFGHPKSQR